MNSKSGKDGASTSAASGGLAQSDAGSSSVKSTSEVTPEQEYFLYELETSDSGSIGLVLRAIYDGGDVQKFIRALEKKIHNHDKDIEKLCSVYYHGFIEAIRELLTLKQQCNALKDDVELIDNHLEESTSSLRLKAKEVVKYRKLQRNIAQAVDSISLCLPMIEKYAKLQELMNDKRYYPALKTLEQLENTYLPQVERYRFAQKLMESVKMVRKEISAASQKEMTDFLENIRNVGGKIGEVALKQTSELYDVDSKDGKKVELKNKSIMSKINLVSQLDTMENGVSSSAEDNNFVHVTQQNEDDLSAQDMIDYSPIYRCYHIATVLSQKDEFEGNYRKQRRNQAQLVFTPKQMKDLDWHGTLDSFLKYFHEVIGFFVIEHRLMQTAPGLLTRSYANELWAMAEQQVNNTLNNHFGNCTDAEVMLRIKKLIMVFALALKDYGYDVNEFYVLLRQFRDQYSEILMLECTGNIDQILRKDNYSPLAVKNEEEYKSVIEKFPFYQRSIEKEPYPRRFPFSQFVVLNYEQEKMFVRGLLRFSANVGLSQSQLDDEVRNKTNVLLDRLAGRLQAFVTDKKLTLVHLIQITINMAYLEKSCESLDQYISKMLGGANQGHKQPIKKHVFRDARSDVEQRIDEALWNKIDEFLDLACYDWELISSHGRATDYVLDLIRFLNSTFLSFTNLPLPIARHTCMQACKHLSLRLMNMLSGPNCPTLTQGAIDQFSLDVMQCELFAAQCPVPGFEDGTLVLTFADLRQLLDLFSAKDWAGYIADFGKDDSKYVRVTPNTVCVLLEKILEYEKKKNSLFSKGKDAKERIKLLETVLKRVRSLAANSTHG